MKRQWILYIIVLALILGVTIHGRAASAPEDAVERATDLAADYRTLADSVSSLDMIAGDIVVEARIPIDGIGDEKLRSIPDSLPPEAGTAIFSDRFHDARWLHITYFSGPDSVYEDAFAVLSPLDAVSPEDIQLSLNTSWHTRTAYSHAEKKELIRSIFTSIEARTVASMSDERIVSASGYSPRLSGRAGAGAETMNITASLCTEGSGGGSTLWLGTPVLMVEY